MEEIIVPELGPKLVEVVLIAEFDNDKGTVIRHQYDPKKILEQLGEDEHSIGDLLLPEGAQNHEWDWTLFLLNRRKTAEPLTLSTEGWEVMDKSKKGNLSAEKSKTAITYITEKGETNGSTSDRPFYCFNLIHTKKGEHLKRGAVIASLCIVCRHQFFHLYKPFMRGALEYYFAQNTPKIVESLHHQLNGINFLQAFSEWQRRPDFWADTYQEYLVPVSPAKEFNINLPIQFPMHFQADELAEASLLLLVKTFKDNIMTLYNALLQEKKVMFLGHNLPSWTICRYVISSCLLLAPIHNVLIERAYPLTYLGGFGFQNSSGYIVGVSNPFFVEKEVYWDVLCDINSGTIKTHNAGFAANLTKSLFGWTKQKLQGEADRKKSNPDQWFMSTINRGLKQNCTESWLRDQFRKYTQELIDASLGLHSDFVDVNRHDAPLNLKIRDWKLTQSYLSYMKGIHEKMKTLKLKKEILLNVRKLKTKIYESDIMEIITEFVDAVKTEEQIIEFFIELKKYRINLLELIAQMPLFPEVLKESVEVLYARMNEIKAQKLTS
jgi:hypothetical protein